MADRAPDDHAGHVIDAAQRLYDQLVEEQRGLLKAGHVWDEGGAELLHMVVTTWVDELADEELLCRHTHHLDIIMRSIVELGRRVKHSKEKQARG